jgi:hypothetical protein
MTAPDAEFGRFWHDAARTPAQPSLADTEQQRLVAAATEWQEAECPELAKWALAQPLTCSMAIEPGGLLRHLFDPWTELGLEVLPTCGDGIVRATLPCCASLSTRLGVQFYGVHGSGMLCGHAMFAAAHTLLMNTLEATLPDVAGATDASLECLPGALHAKGALQLAARIQAEPKGSVGAVVDFSNEAGAVVARASMRFGRQPHCSL